MNRLEKIFICHGEETQYCVRNNPDTDVIDGSAGVVIEWSDDYGVKWEGSFFIAPESISDVAKALMEFAPSNARK